MLIVIEPWTYNLNCYLFWTSVSGIYLIRIQYNFFTICSHWLICESDTFFLQNRFCLLYVQRLVISVVKWHSWRHHGRITEIFWTAIIENLWRNARHCGAIRRKACLYDRCLAFSYIPPSTGDNIIYMWILCLVLTKNYSCGNELYIESPNLHPFDTLYKLSCLRCTELDLQFYNNNYQKVSLFYTTFIFVGSTNR